MGAFLFNYYNPKLVNIKIKIAILGSKGTVLQKVQICPLDLEN